MSWDDTYGGAGAGGGSDVGRTCRASVTTIAVYRLSIGIEDLV